MNRLKYLGAMGLLLAGCSPQAIKQNIAARRPPRAALPTRLEWLSSPSPPKAGLPALWSFKVLDLTTDKFDPKGVRAYENPHGVALHLFVVSRDLQNYAHFYPEPRDYGNFLMRAVLPHGGAYQLFAEYLPIGFGSGAPAYPTWKSQRFLAVGDAPMPPARLLAPTSSVGGWLHAKVAARDEQSFGDDKAAPAFDVTLKIQAPLVAGSDARFTSRVRDLAGQPVALLKHLGSDGYGLAISADGISFVRLEATRDAVGDLKWQGNFAKPGVYKIWLEFLSNDKIIVAPFVVKIGEKSK